MNRVASRVEMPRLILDDFGLIDMGVSKNRGGPPKIDGL